MSKLQWERLLELASGQRKPDMNSSVPTETSKSFDEPPPHVLEAAWNAFTETRSQMRKLGPGVDFRRAIAAALAATPKDAHD